MYKSGIKSLIENFKIEKLSSEEAASIIGGDDPGAIAGFAFGIAGGAAAGGAALVVGGASVTAGTILGGGSDLAVEPKLPINPVGAPSMDFGGGGTRRPPKFGKD